MSKVLLVVGHPDLSRSKANKALVDAVRELAHVTVHDLYATYPDFQIDVDVEQALLADHDVVVFQHPVFWYNTTPLLKQWQDKVFTLGWAFTMDGSPSKLAGKKAVVAVTAGVPADACGAVRVGPAAGVAASGGTPGSPPAPRAPAGRSRPGLGGRGCRRSTASTTPP
ncbi:NAD(P)H-dependent oxidoreductase [Streptomyces sp. NPDC007851]|uniref:NAD(P)H-dependent oxidoreductase n=1 Tax=Streptomyces sp. NPDC007851 TaxID=3155008 RepID=UPI0034013C23